MSRRTPTMPSAPSWSASSSIRVIASSRAPYMAWDRTPISWLCFQPAISMPMWLIGHLHDGGAEHVQRDDQVDAPGVVAGFDLSAPDLLVDGHADDAVRPERLRLGAQVPERHLAGRVDRLGEVGQLLVRPPRQPAR